MNERRLKLSQQKTLAVTIDLNIQSHQETRPSITSRTCDCSPKTLPQCDPNLNFNKLQENYEIKARQRKAKGKLATGKLAKGKLMQSKVSKSNLKQSKVY